MKLKVIIAIAAFLMGFLIHWLLVHDHRPKSVVDHWRVVEAYREFVRNPKNYEPLQDNPGLGQLRSETLPDHEPSLAFLVREGEMEQVDLVLPSVPKTRETIQFWMTWAEYHPDVFEALGNPSYADYRPGGKEPLHMRLWFRPRAKASVQKLIDDLEELASTLENEPPPGK